MELLEFARGPALAFALAVFVIGTLWRLIGVLRLRRVSSAEDTVAQESARQNAS